MGLQTNTYSTSCLYLFWKKSWRDFFPLLRLFSLFSMKWMATFVISIGWQCYQGSEIIAQEWVFIVSWHCHQMFHIFFYLKLVKNAKIGNFWGFLGISTSKSGDIVKSGNFGHFCNVARWFKFKITKNWSKTPKSAIFGGNSHPNLVTLLNLNIKKDFLCQNDLQL